MRAKKLSLGDPHCVARAPRLNGGELAVMDPAVDGRPVYADPLGGLLHGEQAVAFKRVRSHTSMLAPSAAATAGVVRALVVR